MPRGEPPGGCCRRLAERPGPASAAAVAWQVRELAARAKEAGKEWRGSSFAQRRLLLKILLKFIVENQEEICRYRCCRMALLILPGQPRVACELDWTALLQPWRP